MPHHTSSSPSKQKPQAKARKNYSRLQIVRYASLIFFAVFFVFFSFYDFPALFPVLLIATVLGGAFHCGWICPMGLLQDLAGLIARSFGVNQRGLLPRKVHLMLMPLRYILFACAVACLFLPIPFVSHYIGNADARRAVHTLLESQIPTFIALAILSIFLLVSVFYKRVFCSYFCIEGAKQGLLGFFRPATILRNTDTCINCKKCDKACPMSISVSTSGNVQSPQCVNCFQCISACPVKKTLVFGLARPKHDPLGTLLGKDKPLFSPPLRFGIIGLRLALAAAAFAFWFYGSGSITYATRFETVPKDVIETGASVQTTGASYDAGSGASAAYEEGEAAYTEEVAEEPAE